MSLPQTPRVSQAGQPLKVHQSSRDRQTVGAPEMLRRALGRDTMSVLNPIIMEDKAVDGSELAFFASEDLIAELLGRKTFLGVVVHAEREFRNGRWDDEMVFKVRFNENLDATQTSRLLEVVSEYIEQRGV